MPTSLRQAHLAAHLIPRTWRGVSVALLALALFGASISQRPALAAPVPSEPGRYLVPDLADSSLSPAPAIGANALVALEPGHLDATKQGLEMDLFRLVNRDRAAAGLSPVTLDTSLIDIARRRAAAQVQLPSLSHRDQSGNVVFLTLIAATGIPYRLAGENLARLPAPRETVVERAERGLMNSPAHRANILNPFFDRLAVGVVEDTSGRFVFAQIFAATGCS